MEINEIEKSIVDFWKKDKTFEKSLKKTKGKKPYIFYDGPPFATGMPHYGHILGSVTKDIYGRFWTMKGRYVRRVWGWDCHGLPIENIAEKGLNINSKDEIEKIGVKVFNDYCRSKVMDYSEAWKEVIERIGRWVDMENSYKTLDNEYIESVWWAFKKLYDKGYIYEGEKILMYCPRCSTPLSKAEIAMDNSYKNVKDESLVVKFKLKKEDVYALAWTTTPWTLPSNLALSVNPKMIYVYVKDKSNGEKYLLAKELFPKFFKSGEAEILKEVKGRELEGIEYEPLFDYFEDLKGAFKIILGDFVTAEDGTGIVHTAPAFGEDDYAVCKKYNIPMVQPVDDKGRFTKEVYDLKGRFVHDTNTDIIINLKKKGKVVLVKKVEHEYPFCYRCDTKLIYRAIPAWFVDIQKIKPKVMELSKKVNWYPDFLKDGRVKYTIETAPDWNISRNRYWASAIPIWVSDDGDKLVIGSIEELKKYAKGIKGKIDLHKDVLDSVVLVKDGKKYRRVPEVLDCWFESGAMTFAQFHYPFENKELFEKSFPSQFVAEYIGQVRAWFYYMLVLSAILFEDLPFENVVTTGTILTEDGTKMSKSKNNFSDPMELIGRYGVDALRLYLMGSPVMNADNINFSDKGVEESYKKVILILYNTLRFYDMYKGKEKIKKIESKNLTDRWIMLRLNNFGKAIEESLNNYNTVKACYEIREFVEDLSTWYVRINRERFSEDKEARMTLGYVLNEFSKIVAPIIPFVSEKIYQSLNGDKKSVHLEDYPNFKKEKVDESRLEEMKTVREIVSMGLRVRDKEQIGLKWPLGYGKIKVKTKKNFAKYEELIMQELNVKSVEFVESDKVEVEIDTKITKELESEGYAREISRIVQAFRKDLGLQKRDEINLLMECDEELKDLLSREKSFISERTNAKKFDIVTTSKERFKNSIDFNVKGKKGVIGIHLLKK